MSCASKNPKPLGMLTGRTMGRKGHITSHHVRIEGRKGFGRSARPAFIAPGAESLVKSRECWERAPAPGVLAAQRCRWPEQWRTLLRCLFVQQLATLFGLLGHVLSLGKTPRVFEQILSHQLPNMASYTLLSVVQEQAALYREQTKSSLESRILPRAVNELGREATAMKWERSFSHLCVTRDSRLATSTCSCVPWSCESDNVHSVVVGVVGQRATIEPCLHCGKGRQRHPSGKSGRGKQDKLGHISQVPQRFFWVIGSSEDQYSSKFLISSILHLSETD